MRIKFLVADEIKENGEKPTVIGLYPDDVVAISPTEASEEELRNTELPQLSFLISVGSVPKLDSTFKVHFEEPSGQVSPSFDLGTSGSDLEKNTTIALVAKPFFVTSLGTYHVHFHVNDEKFTFPFVVKAEKSPSATPAPTIDTSTERT